MESKKDIVQSVFQVPHWYLKKTHNIWVRVETVQEFLKDQKFYRILDIGCGDGSLSVPLLNPERHLTLLDFSDGMLSVARSRVPKDAHDRVEIVNNDVMTASLEPHSYDLILCVGVLAHAESPEALLERIVYWLKPGGILILEQTEARHVVTHVTLFLEKLARFFSPEKYQRNAIHGPQLLSLLDSKGLDLKATYRYSLPLPGMHRVASQRMLYGLVRLFFGVYPHNRLSSLGNECLYYLRKRPESREVAVEVELLSRESRQLYR